MDEWRSRKLCMSVMSFPTRKWLLWPGYKTLLSFMKIVWRSRESAGSSGALLTWPKRESLTFWALISAPDKGGCSSDVLPMYSEGNNLEYLQMTVSFLSCQILLLFFFESLFGTLCSWLSLWSVYC